ncbi:hypothetical protein [Helicobacter sp. T3_23-1056]
MNQKFSVGKFLLDCFICFWIMVASVVIFIKPLYYIYYSLGKPGGLALFYYDFYDMALESSVLSLVIPAILFYLTKNGVIKYKIYKSSFWCIFVLLTAFWWYLAFGLVHR